jgi:hypothetical protein
VQYAQPVYGAAFSGDQQAPLLLEDYGQSSGPPINRLETAPLGTKAEPFNGIAEPLNPLAEEALEGPAPFPHAPPQFLVNDQLPPATYGPTSSLRRPTPSRKHRSQSSIKSTCELGAVPYGFSKCRAREGLEQSRLSEPDESAGFLCQRYDVHYHNGCRLFY